MCYMYNECAIKNEFIRQHLSAEPFPFQNKNDFNPLSLRT